MISATPSATTDPIRALLEAEVGTVVTPAARALGDHLREKHGAAVAAVLYYGSCLRDRTETDGILDIFVIVDDYAAVYDGRLIALANRLLPPNVFYLELPFGDAIIRTKYAIMTLEQFEHRTSPRCFHTFFWARFAQPCALIWRRDGAVHARIVGALATAIETFVERCLPLLPERFDAASLWSGALSASYSTELRPEPPGSTARLVARSPERYDSVTRALCDRLPELTVVGDGATAQFVARIPAARRWRARQVWRVRRVQGKLINLARIMKAAFTFDGGVDYVLWKIERHSGVRVEATPMLKRHPLLACWPTVWRLYRAGAFR